MWSDQTLWIGLIRSSGISLHILGPKEQIELRPQVTVFASGKQKSILSEHSMQRISFSTGINQHHKMVLKHTINLFGIFDHVSALLWHCSGSSQECQKKQLKPSKGVFPLSQKQLILKSSFVTFLSSLSAIVQNNSKILRAVLKLWIFWQTETLTLGLVALTETLTDTHTGPPLRESNYYYLITIICIHK